MGRVIYGLKGLDESKILDQLRDQYNTPVQNGGGQNAKMTIFLVFFAHAVGVEQKSKRWQNASQAK